jgi:hypothetical protein
MKEIRFRDFSKRPIRYFKLYGDKLRVLFGVRGGYFNVYYHAAWDKDMAYEKGDGFITNVKTKKKIMLCSRCESHRKVRYVIPYDGCMAPNHYCYRCRKKYSIMDIEDAKRFNKIL